MKRKYIEAELEIIDIDKKDIILTSDGEVELPEEEIEEDPYNPDNM